MDDCIFPSQPRTEEAKKEESLELLQMIFSFLDNTSLERFQEWLDALKMTYFTLFFPQPCKEMEIISPDGTINNSLIYYNHLFYYYHIILLLFYYHKMDHMLLC